MAKNRGRPEFQPTLDQRRTVERMKAVREDAKVIAAAIGISVKTLAKHFRHELAKGHAQQRAVVVNKLFDAAEDGNVSAAKALELLTRPPATTTAMPAEKMGKKEAAQAAASDVDPRLRPPPAPAKLRLVGGE